MKKVEFLGGRDVREGGIERVRFWNRSKRRWFEYENAADEFVRKKKKKKLRKRQVHLSVPSNPYFREIKGRLIRQATSAENRMKEILTSLEFDYRFQFGLEAKGRFVVADFFLPKQRSIIEVDGASHFTFAGYRRDQERSNFIRRNFGIRQIARFSNDEVLNHRDRVELQIAKRFGRPKYVRLYHEGDWLDQEYRRVVCSI